MYANSAVELGAPKTFRRFALIKMLVSLKELKLPMYADSPFESPVVGSMKHDKSPSSGDVHLHADPETAYTRLPMLFADCEGLQGGGTEPAANKLRQKSKIAHSQGRQRFFNGPPRELVYAKSNSEARNREWFVRRVYPRLLYVLFEKRIILHISLTIEKHIVEYRHNQKFPGTTSLLDIFLTLQVTGYLHLTVVTYGGFSPRRLTESSTVL